MIAADTLKDLIDSLVIPDKKSAPGNVDREATLRTLKALVESERNRIPEIVDMLVESGKGDDSKARYALHALAVHAAGMGQQAKQTYASALAATLKPERPRDVRGFIIRQLQVVGGKEVAEALGKLLVDEELAEEAAQALLAIKAGAAEQFRAAIPKASGKARLAVIHGAGTLRDRESAKALREMAGERDRDVRLTALWALANIGDAGSVDLLIKASNAEGYERIKATSACLLLAERLQESGNKTEAAKIWTHLRDSRTDASERHVKEAATRALSMHP
jgi:HEAT repeat protein